MVCDCVLPWLLCSCLPCPQGHYCLPGSTKATGVCPPQGFDCSDGGLTPLAGYWIPSVIDVTNRTSADNSSIDAFKCLNEAACVSSGNLSSLVISGSCKKGYDGPLCTACSSGYAGLAGFCTKCYSPALASFGIILLLTVMLAIVGAVVAVLLPDTSSNTPAKEAWMFVRREELMARLRIVFDSLQVAGLQVLVRSRELEWFVTAVLSVSATAMGGGFGLTTWTPYLCLVPKDFFKSFWLQLSVPLIVVPVAACAAAVSIPLSKLLWKGAAVCGVCAL